MALSINIRDFELDDAADGVVGDADGLASSFSIALSTAWIRRHRPWLNPAQLIRRLQIDSEAAVRGIVLSLAQSAGCYIFNLCLAWSKFGVGVVGVV